MIAGYFAQVEAVLLDFPNITSSSVRKVSYNTTQGYISGTIMFGDGCRLDFVEVVNTGQVGKIKYRYQYMNAKMEMQFRYDNAPHHKHISTFPHHKHDGEHIIPSDEPTLERVLLEIAGSQAVQ